MGMVMNDNMIMIQCQIVHIAQILSLFLSQFWISIISYYHSK